MPCPLIALTEHFPTKWMPVGRKKVLKPTTWTGMPVQGGL